MPLARSPEVSPRLSKAQAYTAQQNERVAVVLELRAARRLGQEMTHEQALKLVRDKKRMPPPAAPNLKMIGSKTPIPRQHPSPGAAGRPPGMPPMMPKNDDDFVGGEDSEDVPEPDSVPREPKSGSLEAESPEIGGSYGGEFAQMKGKVPRLDGESRSEYKTRIHAAIRAAKKSEKQIPHRAGPASPKAPPVSARKISFRAKVALKSRKEHEKNQGLR